MHKENNSLTTDGIMTHTLSVPEAVDAVRAGRMVLICDDASRENEADLCLAAQFVTPEAVNFVLREARGLLCVAMAGERLDALHIPQAERSGPTLQGTAFTASVDALHGTTTGISAADRAATVRALVNPATRPEDLVRPGHVFPLRACSGGTLERRGHTEAAVDLMYLAGLEPGALICETLDEEGDGRRGEALWHFVRRWQTHFIAGVLSVDDIARYRREREVQIISETQLPTHNATFRLKHYRAIETQQDYLVLLLGDIQHTPSPLLRLHSACATGDIFGSQRCDCQAQLHAAMQAIAHEERGILIYLPQEGRGIGLAGKLHAYSLQERGCDTVEANTRLGYPVDARTYTQAVAILRDLHVSSVRLMTNNPAKIRALQEHSVEVERVPLETAPGEDNVYYLQTKQRRLGHMLSSQTVPALG
ncbi:MAG TPA: GTP cyclohydrolase II [Ktedonobacteraceae bacterium]|jgi:3,4-dihydroxy 2-butanone 4-phosphate synthase/GTP cyclohydrolase II